MARRTDAFQSSIKLIMTDPLQIWSTSGTHLASSNIVSVTHAERQRVQTWLIKDADYRLHKVFK